MTKNFESANFLQRIETALDEYSKLDPKITHNITNIDNTMKGKKEKHAPRIDSQMDREMRECVGIEIDANTVAEMCNAYLI